MKPYAISAVSHRWFSAIVATLSSTTPPATRRAAISLTGSGKESRLSLCTDNIDNMNLAQRVARSVSLLHRPEA